jgi:hypothetical protein
MAKIESPALPISPSPESNITVEQRGAACTVICGDSREELKAYEGRST